MKEKPFPTMADALTDARLHQRANELLQANKHSLKAANDFNLHQDCLAKIRDLFIEALAIGANEYAES